MRLVFDTDETFSYETLRSIGYTPYGGADIGEVISTAERVTAGDGDSWYREWNALADRVASIGDTCAANGHDVSANSAYLRASNYYRTAEFFLRDDPDNDPRVAKSSRRAIETFRNAPEIQARWTRVQIPYEGTLLEGYYLNVSGDRPGPTLLAHGGFDSTVEEMYFSVGEAARQHGYNCLIFEGPGQGSALRIKKIKFRHDWEAIVTPVVDFAITLPGVDPDRIALLGMSMGGYLAPRAAAFEPRIAACIAYDGLFSLARAFTSGLDAQKIEPQQRLGAMENLLAHRTELPTAMCWQLSNAMWTFGINTAQGLFGEVGKYDLTDVAAQIKCPTLVCEAEEDHFFTGQPVMLYDALTCPKTFMSFTASEGAGEHCHSGALTLFHQRMFDWLDDTLKP
ncbi:alpha/beta hydrolase family protein [Arthrobacter cryoconiti]|uniref:Alpha/beta hydrolase family protein n=1 Tax=Arthrobacter cryoconiti TaxID=748907 RepID=A0ABV8R1C4_9MICC|nr:alpha/beta fold hydrolase [Arthrobacter cryoconiti]MCC9068119.1 alpha/beta fold hydrolase [Arthrobacter cryoconiti]